MENLRKEAAEALISSLYQQNISDPEVFSRLHRKVVGEFGVTMFTNDELSKLYHKMLKLGKISQNKTIENLLRQKKVRSLSGIVVVSILTKPYDCPGNCLYCPSQDNLPKSYMKNEPAVMRAILNGFDPYRQTQNRLEALKATGHPLDKINIRIIGGTWSYYPKRYQTWYIKRVYQAANEFDGKSKFQMSNDKINDQIPHSSLSLRAHPSLREPEGSSESRTAESKTMAPPTGEAGNDQCLTQLQKENETAGCRLVEISVETRQDYINEVEICRLRELGVTKVELGVQSIYDDVLIKNRRGHDVACTIRATKILKDAGFKVAYQVMLNLAGSDFERDKKMLEELFANPDFRPDYLKIYPLAVVKEAPIYELYKKGELKIYNAEQLSELIGTFKKDVAPKYLRIERIIRDIPSDDIVEGGAKVSNLRQLIQEKMIVDKKSCQCIRCREIGGEDIDGKKWQIFREDYEASDGLEIFLSVESEDRAKILSILRLRINNKNNFLKVLNGAGIVREMHTYGAQVSIDHKNSEAAQHRGYGKMLLAEAENIVKSEFGLSKMAVIAGVGAREYFRKFGYEIEDSYMTKLIS